MRRHLIAWTLILVAVMLARPSDVLAAELKGRVVSVSGGEARVELDGEFLPNEGDSVAFSYRIPDTDILARAGTGKVTGFEGTTVIVRIDAGESGPQAGFLASITSQTPRKKGGEEGAAQEPSLLQLTADGFEDDQGLDSGPVEFEAGGVVTLSLPNGGTRAAIQGLTRLKGDFDLSVRVEFIEWAATKDSIAYAYLSAGWGGRYEAEVSHSISRIRLGTTHADPREEFHALLAPDATPVEKPATGSDRVFFLRLTRKAGVMAAYVCDDPAVIQRGAPTPKDWIRICERQPPNQGPACIHLGIYNLATRDRPPLRARFSDLRVIGGR